MNILIMRGDPHLFTLEEPFRPYVREIANLMGTKQYAYDVVAWGSNLEVQPHYSGGDFDWTFAMYCLTQVDDEAFLQAGAGLARCLFQNTTSYFAIGGFESDTQLAFKARFEKVWGAL